tara:strand:- start:4297 stop:6867 length:2571 start_codon:yes stop_codon:yes gene_type:complete
MRYFKDLFVALIVRPLVGDPFRSFITVVGVAIGVAVFLSIQLANRQTLDSFRESVELVLGRADAVVHAESLPFDEKYFAKLLKLRSWIKIYPVIEGTALELRSGEMVEIFGADLLQDSGIRDFSLKTIEQDLEGMIPLVLDPAGVILPEKFIPEIDFQPGEKIIFLVNGEEKTLNVNAILENKGIARALNGAFAMMDIAAAQKFFGKIGKLDRIDVEFVKDRDFDRMREKISAVLPNFLRVDRPERKNQQVEKMLRAFQYNLAALSFVALLVALYLIYNMIALSVVRRRMEIGTLRALGAAPWMIALIFFFEAGIFGTIGSAIGVVVGYGFAEFSLKAVSVTINNLYVPTYADRIEFSWMDGSPYFLLGLGLSFVSAFIPAWDAACTPSALVMRRGSYDLKVFWGSRRLNILGCLVVVLAGIFSLFPPIANFPFFGFFAVFLLILGVSLLSPSALILARNTLRGVCKKRFGGEGLLACLNLSQNIGRNAIAVSSLAIAFMMIVSMSIMVYSFRQTVVVWIGQTLKADLFVRSATGRNIDYQFTLPPEKVKNLETISGVAAVDLFRAVNASYKEEPFTLASGDFSIVSKYAGLVMKSGAETTRLASLMIGQNRCIVSEAFSLKHRVGVGDFVTLEAPGGTLSLEIVSVYYDYSQERGYVVMDRGTYKKYYLDNAVNSFVIYLNDKSKINSVRKKLVQRFGGEQKILIRTNQELKKEVLRIFDKTFSITYSLEIIAILVAMLGLFNTLISLVLERKREIGILRFIGAFTGQLRRIIYLEAGILGLIGSAMGLIVGVVVSYLLIYVVNKQSFGWTIQVHYPVVFILILTMLFWVVSCFAGWYPARLASSLDPRESVRVE